MERRPVDSTALGSVGYDASRSTLEIEFRPSRAVYRYWPVPEHVFRELMSAESLGRYFNAHIKGNYQEWQVR